MGYSIHVKAVSRVSLKFTKTIKDMNTQITADPKLYIGIDIHKRSVITSYSIHYTKLYENGINAWCMPVYKTGYNACSCSGF